ncbi:hypothetical protein, partial [Vibrio sp. F74]|uniref:hypothetical protein n=1 Tax=Vibrio sp. F74 TaxID=700020 RepID=UPI0035F53A5E
ERTGMSELASYPRLKTQNEATVIPVKTGIFYMLPMCPVRSVTYVGDQCQTNVIPMKMGI